MPSYVTPKKNVAYVFNVSLVSQSNTKTFQANPTLATGDVKVVGDSGSTANITTLPTADGTLTKRVIVSLSAAEMNFDNVTVLFSDAAGAEWCDLMVNIQTSARQMDDLAYPATTGRSMVVDAAGLVDANTVKVGPTGAGTAQTAGDVGIKTGFSLAATGLDAIAVTDPGAPGSQTTLAKMLVGMWRWAFGKQTLTATQQKLYAADGSTVNATATVSDDLTTQTRGAFS